MILDKAQKSIQYFEYKIKYAQNKKLHAQHLNNLIELYNFTKQLMIRDPHRQMIYNLTNALYAELINRYDNHEMAYTKLKEYVLYHTANPEVLDFETYAYILRHFIASKNEDILQLHNKGKLACQLAQQDINTLLQDL